MAERLVVLAPNLVELVFSVGAGAEIVGVSDYADFPEAASAIPRVSNFQGMQLERIAALRPDRVLYWRSATKASDLAALTRLGIATEGFEPQTLDDIASMLERIGQLTNHEQQGKMLAEQYRTRLAQLRQQYRRDTPIHVFYQIWPKPLTSIGQHDWPMRALEVCGAVATPALATPYPQINFEQLLLHPPEVIVVPTSSTEPQAALETKPWPSLAALPVLEVNSDWLHRATLRTLDGVDQLCRALAAH